MTLPNSLAARVARLRHLRPTAAPPAAIPAADPIPGAWPRGCQAYPASFAQTRLWFLHQLEPDLTAYHIPLLWHLRGVLDISALSRAFSSLIERHPTLRTSFLLRGSEPLQIVHPPAPVAIQPEPMGHRQEQDVIDAWLAQERSTPFDLAAGELLRVRLLAIGPEHHVLAVNQHHIASDGWSLSVLTRDLSELYNAHHARRPPQLRSLAVQYHDYAAWQRARLSGERLEALRNYWMVQLDGLAPLDLRTDHRRPPSPSHRGGAASFRIEPPGLASFEAFCRSEGATLQMGLLAVVALLLHRASGQDDFAIGIPIWGRNHPDLEPLIGFFINTLPIRTRFRPDQSFRELLQQIRTTSLAAYDHQELPFEQMVEALDPPRDTGRTPLVQVMLQLNELPEASLQALDGLQAEVIPTRNDSSKIDLGFLFRRTPEEGLSGSISYATDLFEPERIAWLSVALRAVLPAVVADPEAPILHHALVPSGERERLLAWSQPPRSPVEPLTLHRFVAQGAAAAGDAPAVRWKDTLLSHRELQREAELLARELVRRGLGPGQRIGILLERRPELPVALLAVSMAGACYVPVDPAYPQERIDVLLDNAAVALVITSADLAGRLTGRPCLIAGSPCVSTQHGEGSPATPLPVVDEQTAAYLIHTSGSTGTPKPVEVSHRAVMVMLRHRLEQLTPPWACTLAPFYGSIAFDASIAQIFTVLAAGGCLLMLDDIADLARTQLAPAISSISGTPSAIAALLLAGLLPEMIKVIGLGAEPIPADLCERLQALPNLRHLYVVYGLTEAAGFSTALVVPRSELGAFAARRQVIGRPIPGATVHVLDAGNQPMPPGFPGELHIGGIAVSAGDRHRGETGDIRFLPDPFCADPGARLFRTGDQGEWTSDGQLLFHGRLDQQIKLRGFRIEPGEIETVLTGHPAVAQAVAITGGTAQGAKRLVAYWVPTGPEPHAQDSPTAGQLRSHLAERLPAYMVPDVLMRLEALPLTPSGKLDRRALPEPTLPVEPEQRVQPVTALHRHLHAIWQAVLGHGDFGIHDNFFAIGGHSLAAAHQRVLIEDTLGSAPPLAAIFHAPTIAEMALLVQERTRLGATVDPCLVPLQPLGGATPLFVIHGYGGDVFCYTDFARCLAPGRPVIGLQAQGIDGHGPRHRSVEAMAEHYASLIQQRWPQGPYHLLGQSAGGWYAYAVAAALLRRGGSIGFLAILDSGPTAFISRRLRASLLLRKLIRQLPAEVMRLPWRHPRSLGPHLSGRLSSLQTQWQRFRTPSPGRRGGAAAGETIDDPGTGHQDYFAALHRSYRPPALPVAVHLFTTRKDARLKRRLWLAQARGGVSHHLLFEHHFQYHQAECGSQLAEVVGKALDAHEQASTR